MIPTITSSLCPCTSAEPRSRTLFALPTVVSPFPSAPLQAELKRRMPRKATAPRFPCPYVSSVDSYFLQKRFAAKLKTHIAQKVCTDCPGNSAAHKYPAPLLRQPPRTSDLRGNRSNPRTLFLSTTSRNGIRTRRRDAAISN